MNRLRIRDWRARAAFLAAALGGVVGGVVVAEDVFVQPNRVDVREGPSALFNPVESVSRSGKLQVLERTDDGWVKVQAPDGKQGYVFGRSVAAHPPAVQGPLAGLNVTSDAEASQLGTAAAGKGGLEAESIQYANARSYNPAALNRIAALNQPSTEKAKRWLQFCKEGRVGPSKSTVK